MLFRNTASHFTLKTLRTVCNSKGQLGQTVRLSSRMHPSHRKTVHPCLGIDSFARCVFLQGRCITHERKAHERTRRFIFGGWSSEYSWVLSVILLGEYRTQSAFSECSVNCSEFWEWSDSSVVKRVLAIEKKEKQQRWPCGLWITDF